MATDVGIHLAVAPGEEATARVSMDACIAWLRAAERRLTRCKPESERCHLNATAGRWCAVSAFLCTAIQVALNAAQGYSEALRAVEAARQGNQTAYPYLPVDRGVALLLVLDDGVVVPSSNREAYLETCAGGGMLWVLPASS